ncbi:hypothetical protein AAZX31_06G139200 [Glycine max]|uniref:Transmembrane protein n=2 Tax=Glycine subgen. Soja TaxID=1462606 RepID=I1KBB3_SOYBN|nr:uncharacterized protein LOC100792910 isoform X1 [Glycine max]XP_028236349.1 uncharacterized protein LOC114415716 isoform X1 [Glycine soja]KAG5045913.1 hypothetical protein JHK86_015319 [Glycine max]KAH1125931.1 hypothetical protein GYH30_015111 [Glycine max]KHN48381.1 hypothetical protein glysoja_045446 [Glycine soja]KRH53790.1 hypothetical protein GLYMA_06G146000v4 [Glycine max]RZC07548.1 hypothetical protein D0Y65_014706 [Glycine soja]|eukprot:XP_003526826.1 uncharacterized protein LOC100792910 isoform X2 [Glycine max]
MQSALRFHFQASNPGIVVPHTNHAFATNLNSHRTLSCTKRRSLPLCSFTAQPSNQTSAVGSPSLQHWNLTNRHVTVLNVFACATAICATWLFCSAIPTLLAFKKAAESMEKLMDATREELPNTMAAIRLSGMEISDLTTELSDIGQEITQGVRSSTRAVRLAEERLRRLTTVPSSASLQGMTINPKAEYDDDEPAVARTARGVREGIVKGRATLQMFFTLTRFSRFALNFITGRRKLSS